MLLIEILQFISLESVSLLKRKKIGWTSALETSLSRVFDRLQDC